MKEKEKNEFSSKEQQDMYKYYKSYEMVFKKKGDKTSFGVEFEDQQDRGCNG